jgi:hypothetical protein
MLTNSKGVCVVDMKIKNGESYLEDSPFSFEILKFLFD